MEARTQSPKRRVLLWSIVGSLAVVLVVVGLLVARNANGNGGKTGKKSGNQCVDHIREAALFRVYRPGWLRAECVQVLRAHQAQAA